MSFIRNHLRKKTKKLIAKAMSGKILNSTRIFSSDWFLGGIYLSLFMPNCLPYCKRSVYLTNTALLTNLLVLVWFHGTSIIVGYLIPNSFLYI